MVDTITTKKPLVSIITPCFNGMPFLVETYNSVINQIYDNWEWIIVDDCSTDGSYEFITDKATQDSRIIVFKNAHKSGAAFSRNKALKSCSGFYITFLDSDDIIFPNYLLSQLNFIQLNGPIVSSAYYRKTEKTSSLFVPRDNLDYEKILKGCDLSCLSTMITKEITYDTFFNEEFYAGDDFIFWIELLKKGYKSRTNFEPLAVYNIRKHSSSGNKIKLIKPMYNIYRHYLNFGFIKSVYYLFSWGLYGLKKYRKVK